MKRRGKTGMRITGRSKMKEKVLIRESGGLGVDCEFLVVKEEWMAGEV